MKNLETTKKLRFSQALLVLILVIGGLVSAIKFGVGIHIGLVIGCCIAILSSIILGNSWSNVQDNIAHVVGSSASTLLILISVGMMVGVWIIGGTVPSLLYYGLKLCSPQIIVPLTFVLCAITSVFTGTSYGAIATMGLALFGVGVSMGISAPLMAGAVCSGSFFGDKMSPLSDTTNVAADMSGTKLYDHIASMLWTTVPAALICIVLYTVLGLRSAAANADLSSIKLMLVTLDGQFNISPLALLPALLVLVVSAKKVPAVPAMLGCTVVSVVFAICLQGASVVDVLNAAMKGFSSNSGLDLVDKILSRGGMTSMFSTIAVIILSGTMGASLESSGVINTLVSEGLLKKVKKPRGLILSTMLYSYTLLIISGHQVMPIIMGGRTFKSAYEELKIQTRVLSRTLEDTSTIASPLVPWSASAAYINTVLGVGTAYIPFAFLGFIVPIIAIFYAFTGIAIWKSDSVAETTKEITV
ncbi:Na+/H+ antiporter NhaC [Anaerotignum sp.]|uniref:Na+/H+ antiporter NhaC n=1 Tax=Anaerotignum sp. TaxID=2039241 RepID=UPI00271538A8|nr:Na+/H+ antiporter NhaC [Anaerotignum sp.]